ncbi:hypothetical protein D3C77_642910 [compost metagenome]
MPTEEHKQTTRDILCQTPEQFSGILTSNYTNQRHQKMKKGYHDADANNFHTPYTPHTNADTKRQGVHP